MLPPARRSVPLSRKSPPDPHAAVPLSHLCKLGLRVRKLATMFVVDRTNRVELLEKSCNLHMVAGPCGIDNDKLVASSNELVAPDNGYVDLRARKARRS